MEAPVLCLRRGDSWHAPAGLTFGAWADGAVPGDRPTYDDLEYHLSTLFPPVRPRGYLEVRYLDAQAGDGWIAPTLLLAALMSDPATTDQAMAAAQPAAGRWFPAARDGLKDKLVLQSARDLVALGVGALDRTGVAPELVAEIGTQLHRRTDFSVSTVHGGRAS
jgi:glutamate--cysteine ligase